MQKDILFQCKTENVVLAIGRAFLFFINFVHYSLFRPQSTYSDSMLFVILCLNSCSVSSLAWCSIYKGIYSPFLYFQCLYNIEKIINKTSSQSKQRKSLKIEKKKKHHHHYYKKTCIVNDTLKSWGYRGNIAIDTLNLNRCKLFTFVSMLSWRIWTSMQKMHWFQCAKRFIYLFSLCFSWRVAGYFYCVLSHRFGYGNF